MGLCLNLKCVLLVCKSDQSSNGKDAQSLYIMTGGEGSIPFWSLLLIYVPPARTIPYCTITRGMLAIGNGIAIFEECSSACIDCTHRCTHVYMSSVGDAVSFKFTCVHMSLYPRIGTVRTAQIFFRLASRGHRQHSSKNRHVTSRIDPCLCTKVNADLTDIAYSNKQYQSRPLHNTIIFEDMSQLSTNMTILCHHAQVLFEKRYHCKVEPHTIWVLTKTFDSGGFRKHTDRFMPTKDHFGTVAILLGYSSLPEQALQKQGTTENA